MERLEALMDVIVPGYIAEGKAYSKTNLEPKHSQRRHAT